MIRIGEEEVTGIFRGDNNISKSLIGSDKVFETAIIPFVQTENYIDDGVTMVGSKGTNVWNKTINNLYKNGYNQNWEKENVSSWTLPYPNFYTSIEDASYIIITLNKPYLISKFTLNMIDGGITPKPIDKIDITVEFTKEDGVSFSQQHTFTASSSVKEFEFEEQPITSIKFSGTPFNNSFCVHGIRIN